MILAAYGDDLMLALARRRWRTRRARIGKPVPYRLQQLHNVPLGDLRDRHIPDGGKGVAPKNLQPVTRVLEVGQPSAPDLRLVHPADGFDNGGRPGLGPALPCLRLGRPRLLAAAQRHPIRLRRLTRLRQGDGGIPAKDLVRAPAVHLTRRTQDLVPPGAM